MNNPIFDGPPEQTVRNSAVWKAGAALGFVMISAQTVMLFSWGKWVTENVTELDRVSREHALRIAYLERAAGGGKVTQNVNVGDAAGKPAATSSKTWLTTQEVALREKITDRTVLNYIEAGMIDPQPQKQGKSWVIAEHYRIVPNGSENCGTEGGDE